MSTPIQFLNSPGKYDAMCTAVRTATRAEGCVLVVINGTMGSGFSAQVPPDKLLATAEAMEIAAQDLRRVHAERGGDD